MFRKIANYISILLGTPAAFIAALMLVISWAATGPLFNFSNTWQLFINTGTTIMTFLMVFLIQNTQNRDGKALQLKLDELIRASKPARDNFVDLEDMTDQELADLDNEFKLIHDKYQNKPPQGVHKLHKKIVEAQTKRRK